VGKGPTAAPRLYLDVDGSDSIGTYLLCATPRTGSTLLCGLLASTELAGNPESYFREPDLLGRAQQWGIPIEPDGTFSYQDFIAAAVAVGSTQNGVFGARVMWGTMELLVEGLRVTDQSSDTDLDVLHRAFGPTLLIHLQREDVVAQAVSWMKAEQTDIWLKTEEADGLRDGSAVSPRREPSFDLDMLDGYVKLVQQHNAAWNDWFEAQSVVPLSVRYEDLVADTVGVTYSIHLRLGLDPTHGHVPTVSSYLQGDALNDEWIERYCALRPSARAWR
jgi:trehalose 2-sulfotransferase